MVVQFSKFRPAVGDPSHEQLGVFACLAYPVMGARTSEDLYNLLAIDGSKRSEDMLGIEPWSPDSLSTSTPPRQASI